MLHFFAIIFFWLGFQPQTQVILEVTGFENDRGKAMIRVSRPDETVAAQFMWPIKGGVARGELKDLPPGKYAIACFHDANADGKLNTNMMKLPVEDYGFSNNARGTFGPPAIEAQLVELKPGQTIRFQVK
jgi:uncharacterized protein (DUF2141 family)